MMNPITQGVTIICDETGREYHSITDWGLAVGNNDYIGTPELYTKYIEVPGANKLLDVSQAITGRRTYKSRPISIEFGAVHRRIEWDAVISDMRNKIDGRIVKLVFDNDVNFYWTGRCQITDFDRQRTLGTFKLEIPQADPFKYNRESNVAPWLWDPFDFETGIIPEPPVLNVNGILTVTIPKGNMPVCPEFTVQSIDTTLEVAYKSFNAYLKKGYNYFPNILINGDQENILTFKGKGKVVMEYRGGSL